jgi:hypothetical protein
LPLDAMPLIFSLMLSAAADYFRRLPLPLRHADAS